MSWSTIIIKKKHENPVCRTMNLNHEKKKDPKRKTKNLKEHVTLSCASITRDTNHASSCFPPCWKLLVLTARHHALAVPSLNPSRASESQSSAHSPLVFSVLHPPSLVTPSLPVAVHISHP